MKLLIADDHTLFRDALVQYIRRANEEHEVKVTKDFHEAYDVLTNDSAYDLVVLDYRMPGMDGMQGFKQIREEYPDVKLALMSGVAEPQDVQEALDLGASAYFPKTMSGKALVQAIQKVLEGEVFVPIENNTGKVMPSYYSDQKSTNFSYGGLSEAKDSLGTEGEFKLTPREKDVLKYLAKGESNKEIATALGLQVVTVKLHVRGICRKLNANNRTQAALKANELGLVSAAQ